MTDNDDNTSLDSSELTLSHEAIASINDLVSQISTNDIEISPLANDTPLSTTGSIAAEESIKEDVNKLKLINMQEQIDLLNQEKDEMQNQIDTLTKTINMMKQENITFTIQIPSSSNIESKKKTADALRAAADSISPIITNKKIEKIEKREKVVVAPPTPPPKSSSTPSTPINQNRRLSDRGTPIVSLVIDEDLE